ncbi:TonB-dependent receptor plug (fragment) [Candidatus Sulfopaludibacter sp. SbA3]
MNSLTPSLHLLPLFLAIISLGVAGTGGSIAGTIADPSGGVVPGVLVMARNAETGVVRKTTTNGEGFYAFPILPEGRYELQIAEAGFQPFKSAGVLVTSNAALRVDVRLILEAHDEAVTVTESPTRVETTTTQMGELIAAQQVASIPINGRSYTDLLALQPGVIPASSQQPNAVVMSGCTSAPPSGDLNPGNVSVSGQRETANGFVVNGSTVQEDFNMGAAIVPNLDSIREFRVLTSNFDAEYGNFSGGQVLVTTKSGTNQLHGSAFEFLRNTDLDARNYLASDRARYDRNQFGGTLGGPIRKNRVFFFADYQGARMTQGVDTGLISVPSLANRDGDFSGNAGTLSGTVNGQYWAGLLSQRLGYSVHPGEPYYVPGCVSSEQCVLPNARIPEQAWPAPAKALLPFIPKPNQGDSTFSTSAYNQKLRDDKGAFKIDGNTRWGAVSAYYFSDDYRMDNPYPTGQGGANVPGFNAISQGRAQLAAIGLTTTLGPASINELRFGYMRTANHVGQPVGGVGPSLA